MDLPYSTGIYTQYFVITYKRKESEYTHTHKDTHAHTHVYINTESLCYTLENNTTL